MLFRPRGIRPAHRLFGLHAHPARQGRRVIILETRGIDDGEFKAEQLAVALAAVARHPRLRVDEREPLADEPAEQSQLYQIESPDTGDRRVGRTLKYHTA